MTKVVRNVVSALKEGRFKTKADGTKYIELDGIKDSYENGKRVNDSKSKAIYAIASARTILKNHAAKKKIEKIKNIITSTLGIDEVIITRQKEFSIDHQSNNTIEPIIKGDDFGLKEFIFNPRIWLFLLWDSEDCYNNFIFDVCPGYFNFEVSSKLPIKVKRFLDDPEIQEIEFTKLCTDYPNLNHLRDFFFEEIRGNGVCGYSEKDNAVILNKDEGSYYTLSSNCDKTTNDQDIFEFLGFFGKEENLYLFYVRSTLWEKIYNNYKKLFEVSDPTDESKEKILSEEFQSKLNEITRWMILEQSPEFYKCVLSNLFYDRVFDEKLLRDLNLDEKDIKLFKISIYSRQAREFL